MGGYDRDGNPIAPLNARGLPTGSLSEAADKRHAALSAAPGEGPGAFRRFAQGYGLPTSLDEFSAAMQNSNPLQQVLDHPTNAGSYANLLLGPAGPVLNQTAGMVPDAYEGNYAGMAGRGVSVAQTLVPFLASGFKSAGTPIYADTPPPVEGGGVPPIVKSGLGVISPRLLHATQFLSDLKEKVLPTGGKRGIPIGYNPSVPDGPVGPSVPAGGLPTGVNKPAVNNPLGTTWAGRPDSPPVPANGPAMDAYSSPTPFSSPAEGGRPAIVNNSPPSIRRAAITQNTALTTSQKGEGAIPTAVPPVAVAETAPSAALGATESYLPSHQAVKGQVLAATKTGMTWVEKVEGGNATIATKNLNSGLVTTKVVPIRKSMLDPTSPGYAGPDGPPKKGQ